MKRLTVCSNQLGQYQVARLWALHDAAVFRYKKPAPNYATFWISDSDAVNSMDPFEAILWFVSRGDRCLSHPLLKKHISVRGVLVFQINK